MNVKKPYKTNIEHFASICLFISHLTKQNTKKMTDFHGCHNLVIFIMFILLIVFLQTSEAVRDNPLAELSSREDLVYLAGYGEEKLSTVLVTGTIVCEACLDGELHPSPVSGASVVVVCHTGNTKKASLTHGVTDEYGDFIIDIPSHLHANPNLDKSCLVKVLPLQKRSPCQPTFTRKNKEIRLSSVGNGIRTYTAGRMRLLHLTPKSSQACISKWNTKEEYSYSW